MSKQDCATCRHEALEMSAPPCRECQTFRDGTLEVDYHHWQAKEPKDDAIYMVSVTGRRAPEKRHASLAEARAEAERLVRQDHANEVLVLCLVDVARASVEWEGRPW